MKVFRVLALAGLVLITLPSPLASQEQTQLATYRDWGLFTYEGGDTELCYIASEPKQREGDFAGDRGPASVLVTRWEADPAVDEVSVRTGYTFRDGSDVQVTIDGDERFSLFTDGEYAWTRGPEDDRAMIAAMRAGLEMTVRGTASTGATSEDTYSLLGFTAAYNALERACS